MASMATINTPAPAPLNNFTSAEQDCSPGQSARQSFIFQEASLGELGIRAGLTQRWENIKPLIKKIYIEQNKSFPQIARILRDDHGFEPT